MKGSTGYQRTLGNLPMTVKPTLMGLPGWSRFIYPVWLRWTHAWDRLPLWREGLYNVGDTVYWRGVKLVCCTKHFCGGNAEHPWDPGWGWSETRAGVLWEPARNRDRVLLNLIGDERIRESS